MSITLFAETIKHVFDGKKIYCLCVEEMHHRFIMYIYPASRITGEGRAESIKGGEAEKEQTM